MHNKVDLAWYISSDIAKWHMPDNIACNSWLLDPSSRYILRIIPYSQACFLITQKCARHILKICRVDIPCPMALYMFAISIVLKDIVNFRHFHSGAKLSAEHLLSARLDL